MICTADPVLFGESNQGEWDDDDDDDDDDEDDDDDDNNNNNNKLQLGYHPVAVVILHVNKYGKKVTRKFKSGGLHERHVVATWKLGNHLSIRL